MFKKSEIDKLSRKLGWNNKEVKDAIREFTNSPSIIDCEKFLKICTESDNPPDRWDKIVKFLLETLNGDPVETICSLLYIDPCFVALSLFNIHDFQSELKEKWPECTSNPLSKWPSFAGIRYHNDNKKSFLNWGPEVRDLTKSSSKLDNFRYVLVSEANYYINSHDLSFKFLDIFIKHKSAKKELPDIEKLIFEVVSRVGLLALNIDSFRLYVTVFCYNPYQSQFNKNALAKLFEHFISPFERKNRVVERRYWLMYALVECLKDSKACNEKKAIAYAGSVFIYGSPSSITPRYYKRKKEATRKNLALKEIIKEYNLSQVLSDLLRQVKV